MAGQSPRFLRQFDENQLRNILGLRRVAVAFATGDSIDEVKVPADEFSECRFVPLGGIFSQ
jgi:hypothetical protein